MKILPVNYDKSTTSFGTAYNLRVGINQTTMPVVDSFLPQATKTSENMGYDIYFAIMQSKDDFVPSLKAYISGQTPQPLTFEQLKQRGCQVVSVHSRRDFNELPNSRKLEQLGEILAKADDYVFHGGLPIFNDHLRNI